MLTKAIVFGDLQAPLYDEAALSILLQVVSDFKPDRGVINGDVIEFRHLSMRYPALKGDDGKRIGATAAEEAQSAVTVLKLLVKACIKTKWVFNEGNHDWRLVRVLQSIPQILEIMGLPNVKEALRIDKILGLAELGIKYSGEYPKGCWLFDRQAHNNVFVHHSFITRIKAGFHANAELDKRGMYNMVVGHGERLACVWRRDIADRRVFSIEGGGLSKLGEPQGKGIYTTVPFNAPEFLDRQQGFSVIYQHENDYWPVLVPIHRGRAIFMGKLYKG
jgi:hypothetical protein